MELKGPAVPGTPSAPASGRSLSSFTVGKLGGGSGKRSVKLNIEYMNDRTSKVLLRLGAFMTVVGLAVLIWEATVKFGKPSYYLLRRNVIEVINVVVASVGLPVLLIVGGFFAWSSLRANREGKRWSRRRRVMVLLTSVEITLQLVNLAFLLVPNALELAQPCSWLTTTVTWSSCISWMCWNGLALVWMVQAHNLMPVDGSEGWWNWALGMRWTERAGDALGPLVIDLPTWIHLPKVLLLFLPAQFMNIFETLDAVGVFKQPNFTGRLPDYACSYVKSEESAPNLFGALDNACSLSTSQIVINVVSASLFLLMLVVYLVLAYTAFCKLQVEPYDIYRVSNIELRVQFRTKLVAVAFAFVCMVVLWYAKMQYCNSYVLTWMGITPMQITVSTLVAVNAILYCPITPSQKQYDLHEMLQDFAWTEAEVADKLEARATEGADKALFCFELAMKALYWSWYIYNDARSLETGLGLFGLERHQLLLEKKRDSKCMVAWGPRTVVVAFRGTASMANVKTDATFLRAVHPPARGHYLLGTQPLVHAGFLGAWQEGGFNMQVLGKLREILTAGSGDNDKGGDGGSEPWRIIFTGHSLGGAMATLASYDAVQMLQGLEGCEAQVSVVTFGAPRTGNSAFAKDYILQVPDSWDVFHNNDAVAVEGKLLFMYKRAAHRVILTPTRDLIVRPSHIEATMQRGPASSVAAHMLKTYAKTLRAVLRAQHGKGTLNEKQLDELRSVDEGVLQVIVDWVNKPGAAANEEAGGDGVDSEDGGSPLDKIGGANMC